jgi:hypothetical protein
MQILKERKPLLVKILAIVLLVLLCCKLPGEVLFWYSCTKQDHNIPPNTEVIVSACKRPNVIGVPGGEVLFVQEVNSGKMYFLDLQTGEKRNVSNDPLLPNKGIFLNSELAWLRGRTAPPGGTGFSTIPHYILDMTNGQRYELLDITYFPRLEGGKFDPKYYVYFQSAEMVFIHNSENVLIALSPDFRTNPNGRIIFTHDPKALEKLMQGLGIRYEAVDLSLRNAEVYSLTGKYFIRYDGIYLSETNTLVVENRMDFVSWYFDESGIIARHGGRNLISLPGGGGLLYVPPSIIKLRIPVSP